jgi:hypothetical protein
VDFDVALQQQLTERQRRKDARTGVERIWSNRQIQNAFIESFELVGGIPRLCLWANDPNNYETFLKLLVQIAPKGAAAMLGEMGGQILEYRSLVPQSPLNRQKPEEDVGEGELVVEDDDH